ncbi:KNR4/SMI1 homolog [Nicotiana sylvestris]|uniref:KNR4/SMI1 homolog n=1 Tax=Nicotiana sylvestris TaxID=4096 RepID=UPI00388C6830
MKVSGEEKALRLLYIQKEEELKDLRTALAKAQKSEFELDEQVTLILIEYGLLGPASEASTSISQLQQKLDMVGQLWGEVDQVRADCHQWKKNIDQLAADKEVVASQLASAKAQLRGVEAKGLAQARKIEGLEAELAKARAKAAQAKAEVVKAKAEAEKTKDAADKSIAIYSRKATVVQSELREASNQGRWSNELAKCQARRETFKEIHARGFNLAGEIAEEKARENDARFLVSSDDEDVVSGSGDEECEENVPEGEETPEDRAVEDEDDTLRGVTPKID